MKDKEEFRTGIVNVNEKPLNFYMENYRFTFMDAENSHNVMCIAPNHLGFIEGKLHNGNDIAILTGKTVVKVHGTGVLNTSMYILHNRQVPKEKQHTFYHIRLIGGTLNKLFLCSALKFTDMDNDNDTLSVELEDDSIMYLFETENYQCEVKIWSDVRRIFGINGRFLKNDNVIMDLKFNKKQTVDNLISYISKIRDLLSIMSFRLNVGVDEIYLFHDREYQTQSQVFIKKETEYTEKDIYRNISFVDLGDKGSNLFSIVFNSKMEKPSYEIGFIPNSDKNARRITNTRVRLVCSALECEGTFINDLKDTENDEINNLKNDIKKIIRSYQESGKQISQKTYDSIWGSIRYWSKPTSDMITSLYNIYKDEVDIFDKCKIVDEDSINRFVKYRNQITHGSYMTLDIEIANMTYILSGLVYCCLLNRIGLSKDEIHNLCEYKLLY